ncbi:Lar family restriction alleviation protein [Massilia sp. DD77]|uniref:Lar family restriction alleviation protein n=1 Tax=Massilia sp. DD77 TaxID=3109349 RepID=UPI002FFF7DE7
MADTTLNDAQERELLPCPFCGGKAEYEEDWDANYSNRIACTACPATVQVVRGDFSRWNRRAPSATPRGEDARPTDLSREIRSHLSNAGTTTAGKLILLLDRAADEIESYYGGMLNWKRTAEAKDAEFLAGRAAGTSAGEAAEARDPDGWVGSAIVGGELTSVAFRDEQTARAMCVEGEPFPFWTGGKHA